MKATSETSLPRSFKWLNATSFGGAMNDNIFKLLIVYALIAWQGSERSAEVLASVGLVFALPYLLIAPIAGNFADRYSKKKMIVMLKATEVGIMTLGAVALSIGSIPLVYATMFLMSGQSAFYGPCKYGIIPELVGNQRLSRANGALQFFTFLAIIAGTVVAPELSLLLGDNFGLAAVSCVIIAVIGLFAASRIETTSAHLERKLTANGFKSLREAFALISKDGYLTLSILALSVFSLVAAFTQLNILDYGFEHLELSREQSTRLFLLTAIGIGLGSIVAARLSGRSIEFGIVPIGAAAMGLSLLGLGFLGEGNIALAATLMLCLGISAGLFVVPLESFIQYRSPENRRGSIQSASAFLSWSGILIASLLVFINSSILSWGPEAGFIAVSFLLLALTVLSLWVLPDFFVKFALMLFTRFCYRMRIHGLENLPSDAPALIVCNHVSLVDALLLVSSQQRRIRTLMSRNYYENANWITRKIVDLAGVILVQDTDNPKKLIQSLKSAREALDKGYLVCVFAEGALTRTGMMRPFKPGFERIVKGTDYPIIPVYLGGVWGSIASYRNGMPKLRPLSDFRYPVTVHYGQALQADSTVFEVQQAVSELSVEAAEGNKTGRKSLGHEFILSARRNWKKKAIVESDGKALEYGELLIGSLLLRKRLKNQLEPEEAHIGVLLPNGIGSCLSNLAIALDQKIGVNLNYTAPSALVQSAVAQCQIRTVICSRKFVDRLPELPLPTSVKLIYLEDLMSQFLLPEKMAAAFRAKFLPAGRLAHSKQFKPDQIATILFSSGSTDEPKGVMLSHHNLISNIESFRSVLSPTRDDVVLATLPHFHSFGYTATLWFPLLSGLGIASHPNPLEAASIGDLAEKQNTSILLTTPSFLLAYTRKVKPEQFENLRFVFTGAEKLQPRVATMFEKRFGIGPLEGYGATELSPVCALSLPNVEIDGLKEIGHRAERLGRVLPGMSMRIIHPETREPLEPSQEGLICIKGPNVMSGYLNKPQLTESVIDKGWYNTGDIGIMDTDGFFAITGRQSRFSKLGGEMISHGAVEKALQESLNLPPDALAVVALQDERKGEKLCVIHTLKEKVSKMTTRINQVEIPNLWKPSPREWYFVESLPVLGSGKIDYRRLKEIASGPSS